MAQNEGAEAAPAQGAKPRSAQAPTRQYSRPPIKRGSVLSQSTMGRAQMSFARPSTTSSDQGERGDPPPPGKQRRPCSTRPALQDFSTGLSVGKYGTGGCPRRQRNRDADRMEE